MKNELIQLVCFWGSWFLTKNQTVLISIALKQRLIELTAAVPDTCPGIEKVRYEASVLGDTESIDRHHKINMAMLSLVLLNESKIAEEFPENLENIKTHFSL